MNDTHGAELVEALRRIVGLEAEVERLRSVLHRIGWSRKPGRTTKYTEHLEKLAIAALKVTT